MTRPLATAAFALLTLAALQAQEPEAAPGGRLQQMESIYQKELSSRHIPLLGKYLTELQRLAATATDRAPYDAEIARIQQVISAGGVLDLISLNQTQSGGMPMPVPMPGPEPIERKQALIALSPALAQTLVPPTPSGVENAPFSEARWRIEAIAAGTYDVLLYYACPKLDAPLKVTVEFNGQTIEKDLEPARATQDEHTFRILRLGSLTLTSDHRGETLRLNAGDKSAPQLILKNLLITKPRPPAH